MAVGGFILPSPAAMRVARNPLLPNLPTFFSLRSNWKVSMGLLLRLIRFLRFLRFLRRRWGRAEFAQVSVLVAGCQRGVPCGDVQ
jgi:hypothetical protein